MTMASCHIEDSSEREELVWTRKGRVEVKSTGRKTQPECLESGSGRAEGRGVE